MQMTYLRLWVLTNVLGFMLSFLSSSAISLVRPSGSGLSSAAWGLGLALGGMQALVLRRRLPQLKVWHWMVATGLGAYVGSIIAAFSGLLTMMIGQQVPSMLLKFVPPFAEPIALILMFGILLVGNVIPIGMSVGIAQVLVLRRHTPNWRLWWTMSLLGFTLIKAIDFVFNGVLLAIGFSLDISWVSMIRGLCLGAVDGVIYGSITAIALKKLRPRHPPEETSRD